MYCSQLDEHEPGSHKEAMSEIGTSTWGIWILVSVLVLGFLCVDNDAGELQPLVLMYRSDCLKPASVLCSRS